MSRTTSASISRAVDAKCCNDPLSRQAALCATSHKINFFFGCAHILEGGDGFTFSDGLCVRKPPHCVTGCSVDDPRHLQRSHPTEPA